MPHRAAIPNRAAASSFRLAFRFLAACLVAIAVAPRAARAGDDDAILPTVTPLDITPPPDPGTHPDEGLMIAGAVTFWAAYLIAPAVILPIEAGNCGDPMVSGGVYDCDDLGFLFIPFAHLRAGGWASVIGGSILIFPEIIGLFMFIGGAAHHHPNEPTESPTEGDVDVSVSASQAHVGLQLDVTF